MSKSSRARFMAIGVGQGDAFFIERTDKTTLVDGGRSRAGFATQFKNVTGLENVDIMVCTHNDADHALGLLGFLECGFAAGEVWLPASWTDRLDDLLLRPGEFLGELIGNIEESETKDVRLTNLGDSYSTNTRHRERDQGQINEIEMENLPLTFEAASERADVWNSSLAHLLPYPYWYGLLGPRWRDYRKIRLLVEALSAATLIREISLAAFHSGALIRWFDYTGKYQRRSSGGAKDLLVPINSEEIVRIRRPKRSVLRYLALTTANKESLVFMCPPRNAVPSILFAADSDLNFSQPIGWSQGMLITAPHHGSESNARAYDRFRKDTNNAIEDVVWVRSDGRFKSRPGSSYLQSPGRRYCTLCRDSKQPKQNLRFVPHLNIWKPVFTRICQCV